MFKPAAEILYMKQAEESSSEDKDETGLEVFYWSKNTNKIYSQCRKKEIFIYSNKTFFGYIHLFVLLNVPLKLPEV
jgi:hypothetical protein